MVLDDLIIRFLFTSLVAMVVVVLLLIATLNGIRRRMMELINMSPAIPILQKRIPATTIKTVITTNQGSHLTQLLEIQLKSI